MIDYSKYKRFFSNIGEFQLDSEAFEGYVEVINGIPCVSDTRKLLTPIQCFATDLKTSKYFLDRVVDDVVELPYNRESVTISSNDHLNYNIVKEKINKLHENNLYLYSRLFLANNNIPFSDNVSFLAVKTANDTELTRLTSFEGNVTFDASSVFSSLGDIKQFVVKQINTELESYAILGITDTAFVSLTCNNASASIVEVSDKIQTVENELPFGFLEDITINDKFLYITDSKNDLIYKYEIAGYFTGDYALANRRNFIEVIGGQGIVTDPSRFKQPKQISCSSENVVVYDSGNYICKIYDINFNFIQQLRGIPFRSETLAAIEFNQLTNNLYVLTTTEFNVIKLYVYDSDFKLRNEYILPEVLESEETIGSISFSHSDSNIWYLCTSHYTYKKLINRPNTLVGRFQVKNIFSNNINTYRAKEWDNYVVSTTSQISALSTTTLHTTVSALSTSTYTTTVTGISSDTSYTTLTSLSTTTITSTVSTLSTLTLTTTITSVSASSVTSPITSLSSNTFVTFLTTVSTQNIEIPVQILSSYTQTILLTALSASTIDVPIISAVAGTATSIVETVSTFNIPISSIVVTEVPNTDYFVYNNKIPINNFWNNTQVQFKDAKFYWNVVNTLTQVVSTPITKPYRYYRILMHTDGALSAVKGRDTQALSQPSNLTGLYSVTLDIPKLENTDSFTGWNWEPVVQSAEAEKAFTQPITIIDTITSPDPVTGQRESTYKTEFMPLFKRNAPSWSKKYQRLDYIIRGDFYRKLESFNDTQVYAYSPTQIFSIPTNNSLSLKPWVPLYTDNEATSNNSFVEIDLVDPISLSGARVLVNTVNDVYTPPFVTIQGSNDHLTFYTIGSAALPVTPGIKNTYVDVDLYESARYTSIVTVPSSISVLVSSLSTNSFTTLISTTSANTITTVLTSTSSINVSFNVVSSVNLSSLVTIITSLSTDSSTILYNTITTYLSTIVYDTATSVLTSTVYNTETQTVSTILTNTVVEDISGYTFNLSTYSLTSYVVQTNTSTANVIINKKQVNFSQPVDDLFKSCRVARSAGNFDNIILFSSGRIYFMQEPSNYVSILKQPNFKNYGINSFSLARDEYIQASTINKELYKVLYDIFTLKNNIIGRFTGFYDKGVFTLTDSGYNYNIDFLNITDQKFTDGFLNTPNIEKYFISENEKSILGVVNRAINSIYDLQIKLFEGTQVDRGYDLIPAFNNESTVILGE